MNVLRDVWTDHLSSIGAAVADLFTVLNKTYYTYYTYYTTHISKIHKTQFHSHNFSQLDFVKPSSGFHPVTWERVRDLGTFDRAQANRRREATVNAIPKSV